MSLLESVLPGIISSASTGLINNALSQHNAREQRAWQEKMWRETNDYNHPAQMSQRMKSAGLNPFSVDGSQGASPVGSGATAQTIPIESPLDALSTLAQIENLNATTNRTYTEIEKLYKEILVLDTQRQYGLLSNQEYERRIREMFEEWDKRNPYTLEADNKEADTNLKQADANLKQMQTKESQSRISLNNATASKVAQEMVTEMYKQQQISADTQLSLSAASLNRAKEATERILLEGRKVAQTISNEMASFELELSKKYRDEYLSADLQGKQTVAARALAEFKEYLSTSEYRESLRAAGLSEAQANASIANSKSIVEAIDSADYQYVFDNFMHRGTSAMSLIDHFVWNLTRN